MIADRAEFARRLRAETDWLRDWLVASSDDDVPPAVSLGVTVPVVDSYGQPVSLSPGVAARAGATPAPAPWAVMLEAAPVPLADRPFSGLADAFGNGLARLTEIVGPHAAPTLTGVPPGLQPGDLHRTRLHPVAGAPPAERLLAGLAGPESLVVGGMCVPGADLLPVAATAGVAVRLVTGRGRLVRWHNAAILAAPAAVAVAGNTPTLFGRPVGHDGRVALLEAALAGAGGALPRATLGTGYGRDRLYGLFVENRQHYPVLDATLLDAPTGALAHLRRHHETVLRWCRPWLAGKGGGLRAGIECLAMSPGPGVEEMVGNVAFVSGLIVGLAAGIEPPETETPFSAVLQGFRAAVADGPAARVRWFGREWRLGELIDEVLLSIASEGLEGIGVEAAEARYWLETVAGRMRRQKQMG